jgi:HAE1 family hydrophobic/amphiphilic exporter-1
MEEVKKTLPSGIKMTVVYNGAKFSEESINELLFTLILSALATSLICWLFLGSWSATLNILMAIPTSILGTFIVIHFLHFTLNTFTVLSLSLVIGIVVDDAIMVLENIVRHQEKGYGRVEAAQLGARQITFAALATTLSLISIFLPVAFMSGIIGRFFFQFGVTIAVAVALSLLEALTLAPMRCAQFLNVEERKTAVGRFVDGSFKWLSSKYQKGLERALAKKGLVVLLAVAFFFGSLFLMKFIRKEFVPSQDMSLLLCRVQTPVGSSINFTNEKFKECEAIVMARPEVNNVFAAVGGFSGNEANSGFMFISLKDPKKRPVVAPNKKPLTQGELMVILRKELNTVPEVKAALQDLSLSGFSAKRGFPIEFTVKGPDWDKLGECATTIMDKMEKNEFFTDVDSDYLQAVPEIQVRPDRLKANERGVGVDAIGNVINALIGGEKIGKYTKDGKRYDVRIKVIPSQREKEKDIDRLWVWNNRGEMVQLKDVITITSKPTPLTITRENRERAITIYSNVTPGKSQPDAMKMVETIAKATLPEGYHSVFIGSSKTFKESFASLAFAFWLGIVVVYMVLASQFNSYKHPIAVLGALPFSISGALIALWAGKQSLNIYSIIGVILLIGLVKKNSILLVDFTNQAREQGMTVMEALKNACPTRLRPILMTSMATVTAAIPPALAIGPGAETRIPMAITIIGGVILSTLITLFFVPCLYSLLNKEGTASGGGKDKGSGSKETLVKRALNTLEATVQKAINKQNGPAS